MRLGGTLWTEFDIDVIWLTITDIINGTNILKVNAMLHFVKSQRWMPKLVHNGYLYSQHKMKATLVSA